MRKRAHNVTLSNETWNALQSLKKLQGKSVSEIIEEAVAVMVKHKKYNSAYVKIMSSVNGCDEKENEELTAHLDSLTDNDLDIVEKYKL